MSCTHHRMCLCNFVMSVAWRLRRKWGNIFPYTGETEKTLTTAQEYFKLKSGSLSSRDCFLNQRFFQLFYPKWNWHFFHCVCFTNRSNWLIDLRHFYSTFSKRFFFFLNPAIVFFLGAGFWQGERQNVMEDVALCERRTMTREFAVQPTPLLITRTF